MSRGLVEHCVAFCRALRNAGIAVTPAETVLATRVLEAVDVGDREDLRLGLRSALVLRHDQYRTFEAVFEAFWSGPDAGAAAKLPLHATTRTTRVPDAAAASRVTLERWMRATEPTEGDPVLLRRASDRESPARADLAALSPEREEEFRRLAHRIARRLALRASRRWRSVRRGALIDLRRTARHALRTGGDPIQLARRARRVRRTRLVVLADVSGSMELYARFLLQFLHALQTSFARVETFVFSTRLTRTSAVLSRARYDDAVAGIAREVTDWSGGTRIGASLAAFLERWERLLDRRTVVLVLSDGWETGDPMVLANAMRAIHDRAGRVIWLNPLLASADYAPEAQGMKAVLPFIDRLLPCHNLASLQALVRELAI